MKPSSFTAERWAQVDAVFEAALAQPEEARAAYLDAACADDPALRQEVEALLDASEASAGFLEPQAGETQPPWAGLVADLVQRQDASGLVDASLGPYRVARVLGRGGMSVVYLAERADGQFEQQVAVKVLLPGAETPALEQRLKTERQILAGLYHPHIARVYDGGLTDDGRPYLVLEYVDGLPIDAYCEAHSLSIRERLRLVRQVAGAVQHAHQHFVIHRDLKPSNILVTETAAGEPVPKLLDFGIAKLLEPEPGQTAPLTRTDQRLLTPEYAAPEQVRGEAVTAATDVYALGVVLYRLLTGRHPYGAAAHTPHTLLHAVLHEEPTRPSAAVAQADEPDAADGEATLAVPQAPAQLQRLLRGDLDALVMKALRKEPADRYATADAFAADVQRYLDGQPLAARTGQLSYRAGKFVQRHRAGLAAAALVGLALAVGLAAALWQADRARAERDRARLEARKAEQVKDFMIGLFEVADPGVSLGDTVTVRSVLDQAAARLPTTLAGQPALRADLMNSIGVVYHQLGLYDAAAPLLEAAGDVRAQALGADHPDVAESLHDRAIVLIDRGEHEAARPLLETSLAIRQAAWGEAHPDVAESQNGLGIALLYAGAYDAAEARFRAALAIREALEEDGRGPGPEAAESMNNLAVVLRAQDRYAEAEALLREAHALRLMHFGAAHPNTVESLSNLAVVLQDQGQSAQAEPLYREVLELRRAVLPAGHPRLVYPLAGLARTLTDQGRPAQAEPLYREAVAVAEAAFPAGHWQTAYMRTLLGGCLAAQDRHAEAEPLLLSGYDVLAATFGDAHHYTQRSLRYLTDLYAGWGRTEEATRYRALIAADA